VSGGQPIHATAVARFTPVGRRAALIVGPPGAGKSDLALRLISQGWRLVGDDYVHVQASGGALYVTGAPEIAGLIEVRGQGPRPVRAVATTRAVLMVELFAGPAERLPEPETRGVEGVILPVLKLDPFEASAVEKVAAAIARL
jgi:hypothetical protein